MVKFATFSFFAHKSSETIYIQNLVYVSVKGPLGGHFEYIGARVRLIEAKSETSEKIGQNCGDLANILKNVVLGYKKGSNPNFDFIILFPGSFQSIKNP